MTVFYSTLAGFLCWVGTEDFFTVDLTTGLGFYKGAVVLLVVAVLVFLLGAGEESFIPVIWSPFIMATLPDINYIVLDCEKNNQVNIIKRSCKKIKKIKGWFLSWNQWEHSKALPFVAVKSWLTSAMNAQVCAHVIDAWQFIAQAIGILGARSVGLLVHAGAKFTTLAVYILTTSIHALAIDAVLPGVRAIRVTEADGRTVIIFTHFIVFADCRCLVAWLVEIEHHLGILASIALAVKLISISTCGNPTESLFAFLIGWRAGWWSWISTHFYRTLFWGFIIVAHFWLYTFA